MLGKVSKKFVVSSRGFGVVESADGFDDPGMFLGGNVRRAFEHQVLEQVREAGAPGPLVFPAHVIPDLQVDDGHLVVFQQNHLQPVSQGMRSVVQLGRADLLGIFLRGIFLRSVSLCNDRRAESWPECAANRQRGESP